MKDFLVILGILGLQFLCFVSFMLSLVAILVALTNFHWTASFVPITLAIFFYLVWDHWSRELLSRMGMHPVQSKTVTEEARHFKGYSGFRTHREKSAR